MLSGNLAKSLMALRLFTSAELRVMFMLVEAGYCACDVVKV